ncbi:hypothetical protein GGI15_004862 [Coemansia interrupta]|uniref:Uncharacterized protein n=1 Tax=Coemansia interrupta TaxID=1126814 RepID=A0A9W8H6Y5_9FUNG|nr:hypothetical protein GGI15_004862 [Coemansia interrupta]
MGAIVLAPSAAIGALLLGTLFYAKRFRRRKLRSKNPSAYAAHRSGDTGSVKLTLNDDSRRGDHSDEQPRRKRASEAISVISLTSVRDDFGLRDHFTSNRNSHAPRPRDGGGQRSSEDDREMMRSMLGVVPEVEEEQEEEEEEEQDDQAVHRRSPPGRSRMGPAADPTMPPVPPLPQAPGLPPNAYAPHPYMHPGYAPHPYMPDPAAMQMVPMHMHPMQVHAMQMQQREADLAKREAEMNQWMSTRQQRRSAYGAQDVRQPAGPPPDASPFPDIFKDQDVEHEKPDELPPSYNLSEQIKIREERSAKRHER